MPLNHSRDPGKIENPILVYNRKTLAQMMAHLSQQSTIALDTESDSLFRYYPKVCLIQISTYADVSNTGPVVDYLVDPLRGDDISPLALVLENAAIEKIIHAAENDILLLQRNFRFTFQNVFDTQLAARILGWKRLGLAAILEEHFGVISDKRMQRTDWGQRPLTPQQLAYAQVDTHYLLALRTLLAEQLEHTARWEEAQEAFAQLSQLRYDQRAEVERSFWQMKGVRDVPRDALGVLESLWQWRESEAQRRNRPPFKVMNDELLVKLALRRPVKLEELFQMAGVSAQQINGYGPALLQAIAAGSKRPPSSPPRARPRLEETLDPVVTQRFEALRRWRTGIAEARGVTPDIIFTNEILIEIAQRAPQSEADLLAIPAIGPWKARNYGPEVLKIVQNETERLNQRTSSQTPIS